MAASGVGLKGSPSPDALFMVVHSPAKETSAKWEWRGAALSLRKGREKQQCAHRGLMQDLALRPCCTVPPGLKTG